MIGKISPPDFSFEGRINNSYLANHQIADAFDKDLRHVLTQNL